jgi:hypothetical protein
VVELTVERDAQVDLVWYHFINAVTFGIVGVADDAALLAALLGHARYDDAYEGPSGVGQGRHGPYLLDTLSPESFRPCNLDVVRSQVDLWLMSATLPLDPDPRDPENRVLAPDPAAGAMLDELVFAPLVSSVARYQLVLPQLAEAPEWRIGRGDGFHEFVVVGPGRRELTLLVLTDD